MCHHSLSFGFLKASEKSQDLFAARPHLINVSPERANSQERLKIWNILFFFFFWEREQLERINVVFPKEGWGARQDSCTPSRINAITCLFPSQNPESSGSNCGYPRAWKSHSYNPESHQFASSWRKTQQLSSWFSWKVSPNKLWKEDWEPAFFSFQPFLGFFFFLIKPCLWWWIKHSCHP